MMKSIMKAEEEFLERRTRETGDRSESVVYGKKALWLYEGTDCR